MLQNVEIDNFESKIFELQAEVCKTLAHPKRLEILACLKEGELTVGELVRRLRLSKANVSQHLALLRGKGVVLSRRAGLNIHYRLSNPRILEACALMREVLKEQIESNQIYFHAVKEKL